ncbi:MAG: DNA polymerase III subunit delta' [Acetobacterales bacterium]
MSASAEQTDAGYPAPAANPLLEGHAAAEETLFEAWSSGRMAHAWMLTGPRGVGKATLAFRFARFALNGGGSAGAGLFGDAPAGLHVDEDAAAFRHVRAGSHPDLLVVERGWDERRKRVRSEIVVDEVRRIPAFLAMTPALGGWRVVIVDAADDMNRNAANAVLKAIEEPPARALILLVSHAPGRLLPTIRSRCRRLGLPPLPEDTVSGLLERWRGDLDAGERAALARLSHGSIGGALRLADEGGLQLYRDLVKLLQPLPRLDVPAVQALADRLSRNGSEESYRTFVALLLDWLARLVRRGAVGEAGEESVPGEDAVAARLLGEANLEQWLAVWEKISRLAARAEAVELDRKQVVLSAFSWLAAPRNA